MLIERSDVMVVVLNNTKQFALVARFGSAGRYAELEDTQDTGRYKY